MGYEVCLLIFFQLIEAILLRDLNDGCVAPDFQQEVESSGIKTLLKPTQPTLTSSGNLAFLGEKKVFRRGN